MNISLIRTYNNDCTIGEIYDDKQNFICYSLELPDKNNAPQVSCIPEGIYRFTKFFSQHLGWVYRLQNVPNRSLIDVHSGNTVLDLHGCITVGTEEGALNISGKEYPAVLNSKKALAKLFGIVGNDGKITITKG